MSFLSAAPRQCRVCAAGTTRSSPSARRRKLQQARTGVGRVWEGRRGAGVEAAAAPGSAVSETPGGLGTAAAEGTTLAGEPAVLPDGALRFKTKQNGVHAVSLCDVEALQQDPKLRIVNPKRPGRVNLHHAQQWQYFIDAMSWFVTERGHALVPRYGYSENNCPLCAIVCG